MEDGQQNNYSGRSVRCPCRKEGFKFISVYSDGQKNISSKNEKLAKTEPVYVALIRSNEDAKQEEKATNEDQIVTVNKDQTKTEYSK